jgi:hypothetical protein
MCRSGHQERGDVQFTVTFTYRASSGLEETKEKVDAQDKDVSKNGIESMEIEPQCDVNQEKAGSRTKQTNRKHRCWIEGIP